MSYAHGFGRKQVEIEYTVSDKPGTDDQYLITKLADGEEKLEQYTAVLTPRSNTQKSMCACMAWRSGRTRPCKHIKLVLRWILEGKPMRTYAQKEVK